MLRQGHSATGELSRSLNDMITQDKLNEYIWAGGDIDGYARSGRSSDITDADWLFLDKMVSAITMIRQGLVSDSFEREHEQVVGKEFDSRATYDALCEFERTSEQSGVEGPR